MHNDLQHSVIGSMSPTSPIEISSYNPENSLGHLLFFRSIISLSNSSPPSNAVYGSMYIVGSSPTGDWANRSNQIAIKTDVWLFYIPPTGMQVWIEDEGLRREFNGTSWVYLFYSLLTVEVYDDVNYTVVEKDSGKVFTTKGSTGIVIFTLPTVKVGLHFYFRKAGSGELHITAVDGHKITIPQAVGDAIVNVVTIKSTLSGSVVHIVCDHNTRWTSYGHTGLWISGV